MQQRKKTAIIVAGGSGTRMKSAVPKQFMDLAGRPVLYHTIRAFADAYTDMEVVLVVPEAHFNEVRGLLADFTPLPTITLVKGGETRFHSVRNGLQQVTVDTVVFVHDGVRPLVSTTLIHTCYEAALQYGSAIPVIDMKDSIREITGEKNAAVDRDRYKIIQTPQTFLSDLILPAFDLPYNPLFTDEATVVEHLGHTVHLVPGEEANIKITRPLDLTIAAALLADRSGEPSGIR
ncbi:2-C-methyl-D-erythritol 4-phosphate cytidylyltransferase [Chitinophaga nivalis]|uniref:2-C-methyl-D-erythritol 4-phosphate cytidylyltransferase n=1 Tax=Chitinophaga nivalis TaxID=2991709 RepID=A0ABT3IEK7_9BACT|nr:2-C-methyl-D-erythritol 4-phosphate cytidylyltransferase [Chitinophaga nivalis]MCW3467913.1 2-C-methyl-D-erythritol 4-phosphate cytidylyltransferase [Chitinophaga nivalis]MCW3482396.1 2-C-methyl-D-erythritol 4-phosphate cytidylyltransferase [Chitinophaga nivalis]